MKNGLLAQCRTAGCGWKCCNFGKEGYILMLPYEYETGAGSKAHLEVVDEDYFGGKKVKCVARDCSVCDKGYKPIMCRTYPYWMRSVSKDILMRSEKCCLPDEPLKAHRDYVKELFAVYNSSQYPIDGFLNAVNILFNLSLFLSANKESLKSAFTLSKPSRLNFNTCPSSCNTASGT